MYDVILIMVVIMMTVGFLVMLVSFAFSDTQTYKAIDRKIAQLIKGEGGAYDYERATEQMEHDMLYEPTYNSEDGSM